MLRHARLSPIYNSGSQNEVVQARLTFQTGIDAGIILHYQDPENFGVALLDDNGAGTVTPRYVEFVDGQKLAVRASGSAFSLTAGTEYALRCVISESGGLQTLSFRVDGTERLSTGTIDDTWSGGHAGLFPLTRRALRRRGGRGAAAERSSRVASRVPGHQRHHHHAPVGRLQVRARQQRRRRHRRRRHGLRVRQLRLQ